MADQERWCHHPHHNAIAYAPSGTPVEVRVRQDGRELVLQVQDYGRGCLVGSIRGYA